MHSHVDVPTYCSTLALNLAMLCAAFVRCRQRRKNMTVVAAERAYQVTAYVRC